MIERLCIENFKSLRRVDLTLGALNIVIGSNSSGKSSLLEALRVLQGVGSGLSICDLLDGKPRTPTSDGWTGLRGGSAGACFATADAGAEVRLTAAGRLNPPHELPWEYSLSFSAEQGKVTRERLKVGREIYDSEPVTKNQPHDPVFEVRYYQGQKGGQPHLKFERSRPALGQFARLPASSARPAHVQLAAEVATVLASHQHVDPLPSVLRGYSQTNPSHRMAEDGGNFATLVKTLCEDPASKNTYLSWLRQLRPIEMDDVNTRSGPQGGPMFLSRHRGQETPAPLLSDGTLRFVALATALFRPDPPRLIAIPELERHLHASRLRLLLNLLRDRAATGRTQIIATTHSPILMAWLQKEEHPTTFYCRRDETTGESHIVPLTEAPRFLEILHRQPISDLFADGWLEAAL